MKTKRDLHTSKKAKMHQKKPNDMSKEMYIHTRDVSRQNYEHTTLSTSHTATHCNTLQHTAAHCNTLQHTATHWHTWGTSNMSKEAYIHQRRTKRTPRWGTRLLCCSSVLQCIVVCCSSVLQCIVVCCSVLQCVAVCCSVLQEWGMPNMSKETYIQQKRTKCTPQWGTRIFFRALQCIAVHCSAL